MSTSSGLAVPYLGSKISLVTNSELRYEGTLITINTTNSTVTLRDVRMSGTENRKAPHYVMPSPEVFDYIIFNGRDIKDLTVSEPPFSVKEDPAVVAVNVAPHTVYQQGGAPQHPMEYHQAPPPPRGFSPGRGGGMFGSRPPYPSAGRGYHRTGRDGMMGGVGNSKTIVGELNPQPNSNLRTQVASAFDFESSNSKFEKEKTDQENIKAGASASYNRATSFFDNISCETLNRQHGRDSKIDREKQRELDTETFGPAAALSRGPRYYRRGYRRPAGGRPGGRGGAKGYNPAGLYRQQQYGYSGFNGNSYGGIPHIHAQ